MNIGVVVEREWEKIEQDFSLYQDLLYESERNCIKHTIPLEKRIYSRELKKYISKNIEWSMISYYRGKLRGLDVVQEYEKLSDFEETSKELHAEMLKESNNVQEFLNPFLKQEDNGLLLYLRGKWESIIDTVSFIKANRIFNSMKNRTLDRTLILL